ncbi:MotB family protein [Methylobacterium oxalidis]|uniref:Flagellar motor protein MotB n=1 Tax=Methylobacterium oxalidis TaxID=944322 RepID=A0A512IZP7_9HYPH|nr:MotB family protein [Methylobacterium oxalidis]GEP03177.1 flagellar motor protein MotB [Methylobacterium oxalidis]GJE30883.1 Peptidoglycan-associated lipoprotein [Methylobacterium oxalidis]GLS67436.1 flagellar motor protein MotB [Methylobacterium oxalidis]
MAEGGHHEIIIVKRHGDHEDGHHGGAWKIALADFMTAMMALFLVMWLINSTSKEQKQTIAEYFNPVKLAEVTHDRKGLRDPHDTPSEPGAEGGKADTKGDKAEAAGAPGSRARESALFQDPYAVLAKLAAEAERSDAASADAAGPETGQPGISGGEAARDPFDPLYWQVEPQPRHRTDRPGAVNTVAAAPSERRLDARGQVGRDQPARAQEREPAKDAKEAGRAPSLKVATADPTSLSLQEPPASEPPGAPIAREQPAKDATAKDAAKDVPAKDVPAKPPEADAKAAETAAVAAIKAEIARAVQPLGTGAPAPRVEVRRTGEGVLISVTDEVNFSMFGIGSAEPTPKVVRALERIAQVLKARPGRIVVRGHTDGRPFRSETYDNWRLSSARAQMASYMLVRGGVDEARVERIEGYADRQPRNAADPKAAENRRIEILLRGQPE